MTFTVLTHNAGNTLASPDQLVAALRRQPADIACLQELDHPQADAIRAGLGDIYAHQAIYAGGIPGKAILSRFPVAHHDRLNFNPQRPDMYATITIEDRAVTVISAHPPPPRPGRTGFRFHEDTIAQILGLMEFTLSHEIALLSGDFNMRSIHPLALLMRTRGLRDAYQQAGTGNGFTLPTRVQYLPRLRALPVLRFDYIWYSARLTAQRAWLGQDSGSDHLPVFAEMRFND